MPIALPAAARTDVGGHREHNEDAAHVAGGWWVVADGMGGHEGGEVASALAVDAAREVLEPAFADGLPSTHAVDGALRESVRLAGERLRRRGVEEPALVDMGTTMVAAALAADGVLVACLGDSRAYLLVDGALTRLTRDDNVAEEMLALGMISAEQAQTHPGQYQLTKAITAYDPQVPEPAIVRLAARGRLMLCSDGLTGELGDETIAGLLAAGGPDDAAEALVAAAVRAPARDNVTVVVVDLDA